MTELLLVFGLVFIGLAVTAAVVAALMHNGFYEQPVEGMAWRAPVAAAAITAFLGFWALIEHKSPGRFDSLFSFGATSDKQFEQFWSERKSGAEVTETLYHRHFVPPGRVEYIDANGKAWRRSDSGVVTAIIVEEDGERRRFVAQLGPDDTFLRDPSDPNSVLPVRYIEDGGKRRVMTEDLIGTLSNTRYGALILNTLVNLVFLALWIIVIGLAFELQWSHAIVLGIVGWVATLLMIWPAIQARVPLIQ
jgi:hypothetical protein